MFENISCPAFSKFNKHYRETLKENYTEKRQECLNRAVTLE